MDTDVPDISHADFQHMARNCARHNRVNQFEQVYWIQSRKVSKDDYTGQHRAVHNTCQDDDKAEITARNIDIVIFPISTVNDL